MQPEGVNNDIIGAVVDRFEKKGYKLIAMKMHTIKGSTKTRLAPAFYKGPSVVMIWEGKDVVENAKKLLGDFSQR